MTEHFRNPETIAAIATSPGRGSVGIVRVSGPQTRAIAEKITRTTLKPRYAHYGPFYAQEGVDEVVDHGIALFFQGPNSFTGEDVLELQGHGGPVILDCLLREVVGLGARLAKPGEFSEQAFLNDKMDLAQAEAIADLIEATSEAAARSAIRSLEGEFSKRINELVQSVIHLRMYVEAAIDFPEEEIDFLADGKVADDLQAIIQQLNQVLASAQQGSLLRDGMTIVIAGRPNAGKSSLLNALSGRESAIVTDIAGTTRDVLREQIQIDGMPLHIIDTAGLRDAPDEVERIGIQRAWDEIERADRVLLMVDSTTTLSTDPTEIWPDFVEKLPHPDTITVIQNKCDLSQMEPALLEGRPPVIRLSAKNDHGVELLRQHLKAIVGYQGVNEGSFTARRRHIEALRRALVQLEQGEEQLTTLGAGELLAEDLRVAQSHLDEITGRFTPDDLLGSIFSSFCIGK